MEDSIKDADPELGDLLREIDLAEAKCQETLKKLQKQRLELTGSDLVEFTVSTIHKGRMATILDLIMRVDKSKSYSKLKEEYRASIEANEYGWFGTIKATGSKEKLVSVLHKLAKHGATVTVDPSAQIEIPPPNKWWDVELEIEMDFQREAEKRAKRKSGD